MLKEGDEVELNEQDGKRLVEAGVSGAAVKRRAQQKVVVWGVARSPLSMQSSFRAARQLGGGS